MIKKKKLAIYVFILLSIIFFYKFLSTNIGKEQVKFIQQIKYLVPENIKDFVKKKIFVFKYNKNLENQIKFQSQRVDGMYEELEGIFDYAYSFKFKKTSSNEINLNNSKLKISKFTLDLLTYNGPRAYLQYYDEKLFLITGTGKILFTPEENITNENLLFYKIDSNILEISNKDNQELIQVKDFLIDGNKIYVSYLNKKKENCYENKIIQGELSNKLIEFKLFFSTKECKKYATPSVGGNLSGYKNNQILITIGDYYCYEREQLDFCEKNLPQSENSYLGKIIAINKENKKTKIMSIGHRNSQGLFYDQNKNVIWSTDHGPEGGDEINIIIKPDQSYKNFGWPISSYGKHYEGPGLKKKYEIAPLNNSHDAFGFEEPLKYFTPAIGISQIIKLENFLHDEKIEIFVGGLGFDLDEGDLSLHNFVLNNKLEILEHNIIPIYDRVRDIEYIPTQNKIILFLESSGSIAILELI